MTLNVSGKIAEGSGKRTSTSVVPVSKGGTTTIYIHAFLTAGSVRAFNLTFKKKEFTYKGRKHGYLLAKCANGEFVAQAESKFHDGTEIGPGQIVRPCTPKG